MRLLDLTRSLRRVGGMPTGVDRVERAYLRRFLKDDVPCFGLLRTPFGYLLLDRAGLSALADGLEGRVQWGGTAGLSRLPRGRDQALTQAETAVRRLAVARCVPMRLRRMLGRHLAPGFAYYNVGHSNLTDRVLRSVGYAGGTVHVLVHDVIPLELPDMQRPGTVRPFREKLQRVGRLANRVIYPSEDSRGKAEERMKEWGRVPPGVVAPLGVSPIVPDPEDLPEGLPPARPYFVTVGTIEPRKNHGFLLDLWEDMGVEAPPLLICGSRGWQNEAVFARLDALPPDSLVKEVSGLPDAALGALVGGAAGLLAPSLAEGFGLPPLEALRGGTPVIANDIPVFREVLGDYAQISPIFDREKWLTTVKKWGKDPSHAGKVSGFEAPSWEQHFNIVLRLT